MRACETRCVHSKCPFKCSDPCVPCKEDCAWKCEHTKCTRKCNEPCNREPCNEPCKRKLKRCSHPCIGLCGEPCPPMCRICHWKTVTDIFFGNEDEPNARFVFLPDCRHIVESTGMDEWIRSRYEADGSSNNNTITLPECPKCKTPIRTSLRYGNVVKRAMAAIERIKRKQYGDADQNEAERYRLINDITLELGDHEVFEKRLLDELDSDNVAAGKHEQLLSFNDLAALRNLFTIKKRIERLNTKTHSASLTPLQLQHVRYELDKIDELIFDKSKSQLRLCEEGQRLQDVMCELDRIEFLINYYMLRNRNADADNNTMSLTSIVEIGRLLADMESHLVKRVRRFETGVRERVEKAFGELKKLCKVELTREEKLEIVKAMGVRKGSWYECPNGHLYCIGECGGAMQEARCPECKATIGGSNHRVVTGNRFAGHMDDAEAPAWPS